MINQADNNTITKAEWIFIAFLVAFSLLFVFVEQHNGRFQTSDFRVYYDATHDFFSGNNPYQHSYGLSSGYFKYTPTSLFLFSPQLLVSYQIGQLIHVTLLTFSLIIAMLNVRYMLNCFPIFGNRRVPYGMLYLLFACVAIHITRELHLGNINLLLIALFTLGVRAAIMKKELALAIFWSFMIVLKPIMILVVLPLIINKQWKTLGFLVLFGSFFFLLPMIYVGMNGNLSLWNGWLGSLALHQGSFTSFNTIGTLVEIHFGFTFGWLVALICLLTLSVLMGVDAFLLKRDKLEIMVNWSAVFAAFIPNFFLTDTEHFLLSVPLIWLLFGALINDSGRWYHWISFAVGMLLFSFNSTDLLGNLSDFVYDNGLLGIGNLVFISTFLVVKHQNIRVKKIEIP